MGSAAEGFGGCERGGYVDRIEEGGVGAAERSRSMGGVGFVKADREEDGGGGRGMRLRFDGGCN